MEGVGEPRGSQHVIGQDRGVEELEDAVLGGLDGHDIALERGEGGAQLRLSLRRYIYLARSCVSPTKLELSGCERLAERLDLRLMLS